MVMEARGEKGSCSQGQSLQLVTPLRMEAFLACSKRTCSPKSPPRQKEQLSLDKPFPAAVRLMPCTIVEADSKGPSFALGRLKPSWFPAATCLGRARLWRLLGGNASLSQRVPSLHNTNSTQLERPMSCSPEKAPRNCTVSTL